MGISKPGEVIVIGFPFSDLSKQKLRPALVLAVSDFDNLIVAQISSKLPVGTAGISINNSDFTTGKPLRQSSYIRYRKIFTADPKLVKGSLGFIDKNKKKEVQDKIFELFGGLAK